MRRFTLTSMVVAGLLAFSAAPALSAPIPGDEALIDAGTFQLNPQQLEPGAYTIAQLQDRWGDGAISTHWVLNSRGQQELHVYLSPEAGFSVDQVLVPGTTRGHEVVFDSAFGHYQGVDGYRVYNTFHTAVSAADPSIFSGMTAVDMVAPEGMALPDVPALTLAAMASPPRRTTLEDLVIVAISADHSTASQNEPYQQAAADQVAVPNRPIVTPLISALGVSALGPLNTYKAGFGYSIDRWYDTSWLKVFFFGRDPQADWPFFQEQASAVNIAPRTMQPGVRRFNDMDCAFEQYGAGGYEYGQTEKFVREGDRFAFTNGHGLLTFTTQGDLPMSWSLKASMAPASYARTVTLTDDQLRAWEKSWQDYYAGTGPKPTLPLAPGTNSPLPTVQTIVNLPQQAVTTPAGTVQQPIQVAGSAGVTIAKSTRVATIRLSQRIVRKGHVTYMSATGLRSVKAAKANGRLVAKVNLRGLSPKGGKWSVLVSGRDKHGQVVQYIVRLKL